MRCLNRALATRPQIFGHWTWNCRERESAAMWQSLPSTHTRHIAYVDWVNSGYGWLTWKCQDLLNVNYWIMTWFFFYLSWLEKSNKNLPFLEEYSQPYAMVRKLNTTVQNNQCSMFWNILHSTRVKWISLFYNIHISIQRYLHNG